MRSCFFAFGFFLFAALFALIPAAASGISRFNWWVFPLIFSLPVSASLVSGFMTRDLPRVSQPLLVLLLRLVVRDFSV